MNQWRSVVLVAVAATLVSTSAVAQVQSQWAEYSAKFLCGTITADADLPPGAAILAPGIYNTSINIHNPQLPLQPLPKVVFAKKAVLSSPEGATPIAPSAFRVDTLIADFSEEVDCKIIRSILGTAGANPFIEGFVVFLVVPNPPPKQELDVVGVYTVTTAQGQSVSLEMERIAPRFFTLPLANATRMREMLKLPPQSPKKP